MCLSWLVLCSADPYQWTPEHTHRWAEWTLKLYNFGQTVDFFMDGTSVCMLSRDDFQCRCPDFGEYLYAELELWKSGECFCEARCLDSRLIL